jgi:hypothetical protein
MTGNRIAHPLLLSLTNIESDVRNKSSNNAFLLLALLPCPKFLHPIKEMRGPLENRVLHHCLDIVCAPLKIAATLGRMMTDPLGNLRLCHTPLAVYIADTPEAVMLAGVAGLTSHMTLADYRQFGDAFRHEPRVGSTTLAQIDVLTAKVNPWNLQAYYKAALADFRLNTVHLPFWRNWPLSDPSHFLTPEPLHHWHKAFHDHDVKWCINVLGDEQINFRFMVLQPRVGWRHFSEGIAGIKQATGREHRDIQRYLVSVIAGAAPPGFIIAIRALMDFRYLAQSEVINESMLVKITAALDEFHQHKHHILAAGARRGAKNKVINNWRIPKLELMQSVVDSVRLVGPSFQWSADITEHCNITHIKDPARAGNNKNHDSQICRHLDREEKSRLFDLSTSLRQSTDELQRQIAAGNSSDSESESDDNSDAESVPRHYLLPLIKPPKAPRKMIDHFINAKLLLHSPPPYVLRPLRTFSTSSTAFHLNHRASKTRLSVDLTAALFKIPDLRPALADYVKRVQTGTHWSHNIGGRRSASSTATLPFSELQIWHSVKLQLRSVQGVPRTMPAQTLYAAPPSKEWPLGRNDAALLSNDKDISWPGQGIFGKTHSHIGLFSDIVSRSYYCAD